MNLIVRLIGWFLGPAFSIRDTIEASDRLCRAIEELQDELRKGSP